MAPPRRAGGADEERERYRELLEELRVILPGVQVLFAFLLTAPFSSRFPELDPIGHRGYFVALVGAGVSTVLLLMPASYHRIAPRADRLKRLHAGVRATLVGLGALVVAIVAALFTVTRFVFTTRAGVIVAGAVLVCAIVLWYLVPLRRRLRDN